jgi:signal transduction histidine kinase
VKPTSTTGDKLTRAFDGFRRAAATLEERQEALQREAERLRSELLDAHRRLEAVLDALETGVAVLSADAGVLRANRAYRCMGLDLKGDAALVPLLRRDAGRAGTTRLQHQTDQGLRDLAVSVVPVGDREGCRVLTVHDVTEIRREEEAGGRSRRLEALGHMAAELAHELRNPLGSIRLFAGMLQQDLRPGTQHEQMAAQILDASASMETTLSNLLAFAAPPRAARRDVDLAALATDTCTMLSPSSAQRGVELQGPESPGCPVWADVEAMRKVLLNLLGNALAATTRGGRIRVSARSERGGAVLTVEDSGRGIESDDLARVFDPFFSRSEGGTGLGLSVVQRIVEDHGGRISLRSDPGKGTTARVELPPNARMEQSE